MARLTGKNIGTIFQHDSGVGDGSTVAYVLSNTPHSADNVMVFLNGLLQKQTTDYSVSGSTVTFVTAPATAQDILLRYIKK